MGDSSGGRERERGEWERERELLLLAEAKVGFIQAPCHRSGGLFGLDVNNRLRDLMKDDGLCALSECRCHLITMRWNIKMYFFYYI